MAGQIETEFQVAKLSIIAIISLIFYYYCFYPSRDRDNSTVNRKESLVASCENPNCVRCRRYRYVQEQAKRKLSWILRDLESRDASMFSTLNRRIPNAILKSETSYSNDNQYSSLQNPTVLMVSNLPSREIVTDWHQDACRYLKEHQTRTIVSDTLQYLCDDKIGGINNDSNGNNQEPSSPNVSSGDSKWTINDSSPQGDWRVFQILNQGVWNPVLLSEEHGSKEPCRKLLDLVQNIPGLLSNSLFGNVFVSKIYPGTLIEPHCGPTNIRHRLQFLLKLPDSMYRSTCTNNSANPTPKLSLSVGRNNNMTWDMNDDTFVFDDSFTHSVTYLDEQNGHVNAEKNLQSEASSARMVLIVDLWHPALQSIEKNLVTDLYPPYTSLKA